VEGLDPGPFHEVPFMPPAHVTQKKNVFHDAKVDKSSIHDIVLVGGSTRIPKVQSMLQDFFDGKELCRSVNPDEAVAYGAAIQASILSGGTGDGDAGDFVLADITPLSLGIGFKENFTVMKMMIPRNTVVPVSRTDAIFTLYHNQRSVKFPVYEGESARQPARRIHDLWPPSGAQGHYQI
jgi:heat shock 70kDa protein 1/2/6/8